MKTRLVCCLCFAVAALAAIASPAPAKPPVELELLGVKKVWDKAPHNAFTDLVRFKDKWYLTFREAASHMYTAPAGKIRVLVSDDGETWTSAALLKYGTDDDDLRDSKLSVMPDGRLLLVCAGAQGGSRDAAVVCVHVGKRHRLEGPGESRRVQLVALARRVEPGRDGLWPGV